MASLPKHYTSRIIHHETLGTGFTHSAVFPCRFVQVACICSVSLHCWVVFHSVTRLLCPLKDSRTDSATDKASVNTHVLVFCEATFSFFWDKCPKSVIAKHTTISRLVLKETAQLSSRVLHSCKSCTNHILFLGHKCHDVGQSFYGNLETDRASGQDLSRDQKWNKPNTRAKGTSVFSPCGYQWKLKVSVT